jgi:hypothetical protein
MIGMASTWMFERYSSVRTPAPAPPAAPVPHATVAPHATNALVRLPRMMHAPAAPARHPHMLVHVRI